MFVLQSCTASSVLVHLHFISSMEHQRMSENTESWIDSRNSLRGSELEARKRRYGYKSFVILRFSHRCVLSTADFTERDNILLYFRNMSRWDSSRCLSVGSDVWVPDKLRGEIKNYWGRVVIKDPLGSFAHCDEWSLRNIDEDYWRLRPSRWIPYLKVINTKRELTALINRLLSV